MAFFYPSSLRKPDDPPLQAAVPFWEVSADFDSLLILNNSLARELPLRVDLFNREGKVLSQRQITLGPRENRFISFAGLFNLEGSQSGSLQLRYPGHALDLGLQVERVERATGRSLDIPAFFAGQSTTTVRTTLLLNQPGQADSILWIANTADEERRFQLKIRGLGQVIDNRGGSLTAGGSFVLEGSRLGRGIEGVLGVELEWEGSPGDLIGGTIAQDTGFLAFWEPARQVSSRLTLANLWGFSKAGNQDYPVLLYNRSPEELEVELALRMQGKVEEEPETVRKRVRLGGQYGRILNLSDWAKEEEPEAIEWATLDIEWQGAPEALSAYSFSRDSRRNSLARNPLVDPEAKRAQASNYPWILSDEMTTRFYFKNPTDVPRRFVAHLFSESGEEYDFGIPEIAAHGVYVIDLGQIQKGHIPDRQGRILSAQIRSGQLMWFPWKSPHNLVGRAVLSARQSAAAISLSCSQCVIATALGLSEFPVNIDAIVDASQQTIANLNYYNACNNQEFLFSCDVTNITSYVSSDPSVATVDSTGLVHCLAPGSCTITGSIETERELANCSTCTSEPIPVLYQRPVPVNVSPCNISISATSPDNFEITTAPTMPRVNASASVQPPTASVQWQAQIVFSKPSNTCSGGPDFDSPVVSGSGISFSPSFGGFFGGALNITGTCELAVSASDMFPVGGSDPGKAAIQAEIGNAFPPFDAGDLKRIACLESSQHQFEADGLPFFGGGGDAGVFQVCFMRTANDLWNWKGNVARGKAILSSSLNFSMTFPQKVRTMVVRGMGPYPSATDFTDDQLRREAIKRFNAGTGLNVGYWQWDDVQQVWVANPQGGGDPNYVADVLARSPSCP